MRRRIFIKVILLLLINVTVSYAASLGTLSTWISSSEKIGRWSSTNIKIYAKKLNTNSSFYYASAMSHAADQWDDVLGISLSSSSSSSYSSAPIVYYGGTWNEVLATGEVVLKSGTNGRSVMTSSLEGTWTYQSSAKEGRKITKVRGYVLDKGHTANQYKKTCTHELGHALGWYGHSALNSDIMYPSGSSVTSLTNRDKNHLKQVY